MSSLPSLDAPEPSISRRNLRFEKPPQKETPYEWLTLKEKRALAKSRRPKSKKAKSRSMKKEAGNKPKSRRFRKGKKEPGRSQTTTRGAQSKRAS